MDVTITAKIRVTAVDDADLDEIHDDFRTGVENWVSDSGNIMMLDQATVAVSEDA